MREGERDRERETQILIMLLPLWVSIVPGIKLFSNENQDSNPTAVLFAKSVLEKLLRTF